jgi:hypothetical protein
VDLRELIRDIVVAPKAPPYLKPAVNELFKRFGFDAACVRDSRLNEVIAVPDPASLRVEMNALFQESSQEDGEPK